MQRKMKDLPIEITRNNLFLNLGNMDSKIWDKIHERRWSFQDFNKFSQDFGQKKSRNLGNSAK